MTKEKRESRSLALAACTAVLVFLAAVIHAAQSASQPAMPPAARDATARVGDFALLDHEGKYHQLYRYVDSRAVVLFVYGSDCNIARDTIPALKQLREQFAKHPLGRPRRKDLEFYRACRVRICRHLQVPLGDAYPARPQDGNAHQLHPRAQPLSDQRILAGHLLAGSGLGTHRRASAFHCGLHLGDYIRDLYLRHS